LTNQLQKLTTSESRPDPHHGNISRRCFVSRTLAAAAAPSFTLRTSTAASSTNRVFSNIEHLKLHGDPNTYCGHPRQCGLFNFGRGEIVVMHNHAPSMYQVRRDIQHDFAGYHSRSVVLLQRSTDGGRSWPGENEVEVWNEAASQDEREKFLLSALTSPRQSIDLSHPDSVVLFPRTFLGADSGEVVQ